MVEQKYFKGGQTHVWGAKYTKYNKINNNSENFKGTRFLLGNFEPPSLPP